jgi:accessory colonization factor AcfC
VTEDVARSYRDRVSSWRNEVAATARGTGAAFQAVNATDDVEALLLQTWRSAGVLR